MSPQLSKAEHALTSLLIPEHDCGLVVVMPQQVLGEVKPRTGEPAGAELRIRRRHAVQPDYHFIPWRPPWPVLGHDTTETPHLGPEGIRVVDGPAIQRGIVAHRFRACRFLLLNMRDKSGEIRALHPPSIRRPEGSLGVGEIPSARLGQALRCAQDNTPFCPAAPLPRL